MESENKKCNDFFSETLWKFDMFKMPITLGFNKSLEFKTVTGGILSILLYAVMTYIAILITIRVLDRK